MQAVHWKRLCALARGNVYTPLYKGNNMLLECFSANSDLPPIGFCNEFLIGYKYAEWTAIE